MEVHIDPPKNFFNKNDEHTCGENFSCPICKEGGTWDQVDLMDQVAKIHNIDMLNEEFSWKAARKIFQQSIQELSPQKEKKSNPRSPSSYTSSDDSSASLVSQKSRYKKSAIKRNMAKQESEIQSLQRYSKITQSDIKNIEHSINNVEDEVRNVKNLENDIGKIKVNISDLTIEMKKGRKEL